MRNAESDPRRDARRPRASGPAPWVHPTAAAAARLISAGANAI